MRVLATVETVDQLFERADLPFDYVDADGQPRTTTARAWRCRTCGWKGFGVLRDLPLPHECDPALHGAATVDVRF